MKNLTKTSYAPFFLLATTVHAFPVGWVLWNHGTRTETTVINPPSFQVVLSEVESPLSDLRSISSLPVSLTSPKSTPSVNLTTDHKIEESSLSSLRKGKKIPVSVTHSLTKDKEQEKNTQHHYFLPVSKGNSPPPPLSSHTIEIKPNSKNRAPIYPLEAREQQIEGTVWLQLTISSSGRVKRAESIAPFTNPLLEKAALQAVRHWSFIVTSKVTENKEDLIRNIPVKFEIK